ncbi:DEAD/DEAH box helicase [Bifidobacterium aemilianum]|uniref:DEAD/DEAH box helicase n=1 Tax=Bifidobacterium aemilianum TaxID=2493120 RepID=UPI0038B23FA6
MCWSWYMGSGKTLTVFLSVIDDSVRPRRTGPRGQGKTAEPADARVVGTLAEGDGQDFGTQSDSTRTQSEAREAGCQGPLPLTFKALGVDIAKNLRALLVGIRHTCLEAGLHPHDFLVTTPSVPLPAAHLQGPQHLDQMQTVIVDEIHTLADGKRGAHLILSLGRPDRLVGRLIQRIGLSATVRPAEEMARFLGGDRPVAIADPGTHPQMDLKLVDSKRTPSYDWQSWNCRPGGLPQPGVGGKPKAFGPMDNGTGDWPSKLIWPVCEHAWWRRSSATGPPWSLSMPECCRKS